MITQPNSLISFLHDYWPLLGGSSFCFLGLLVAAWHLLRRHMNERWAQEVVELYRRMGIPVQGFLHDRERLNWAVKEGLLCVVEPFKGGWLVAEQMQLGTSTAGER